VHNPAVRKTRRYLLVTLLLAILGFVSWLLLSQPSEPVYQGKPLSYWCEQYTKTYGQDANMASVKQAGIAIRAIGTNAIPTLLNMLKARDSKFKLKLIELAEKQHLINIKWKTANFRRYEALRGFSALGPLAKPALPALIEMYNELGSYPFNAPEVIAEISGSMTEAIPGFIIDTTCGNPSIRWRAVGRLGQMHAKPELAVPALTKCLHDESHIIRQTAAVSLAAFGSDAKSAVPELIKALADPSSDVRDAAASALQKIDPEAAAKTKSQ